MTAALFAMIAGSASAFSCREPDITFTYDALAEKEEIFFLFRGSITLDPDQDLTADREYTPSQPFLTTLNTVYGAFDGEIYHRGGFEPFEAAMEVSVSCVMGACGDFPGEEDALYFVQAAPGNMAFAADMTACQETKFPVSDFNAFQAHITELGLEGATPPPPEQEK